MAKVIETFENATLVSLEQLDDRNIYEWDWRCKFVGCKGTLYIGESEHKSPGKCFVMLTDNKDFRLTTGYGEIKQAEEHITITTKSSKYTFKLYTQQRNI